MTKHILPLILTLLLSIVMGCGVGDSPSGQLALTHTRDWLGEDAPVDTATVFAAGLISTAQNERDFTATPQGDQIFFTRRTPDGMVILQVRRTQRGWTAAEVAPFSGTFSDLEPAVSPDGHRLYFVSNRPADAGTEAKNDYDIWVVNRLHDGWSDPVHLGPNVNTDQNEFYPSVTRNGDLYFCGKHEGGLGGEDLWVCTANGDGFAPRKNLGAPVNTAADEYNAFIHPDGQWIMLTSHGHGQGQGGGDLWVHFRGDDMTFGPAVNLGPAINSNRFEYCPSLSPCGRYLFFTSNRHAPRPTCWTAHLLDQYLNTAGNGSQDIYWAKASLLETLKPKE